MLKYGVFFVFVLVAIPAAPAANWPQWRGPHFNGATDERNLPVQWSQTENVAWVAELPGVAAATPIIWEDRVLLSGVDSTKNTLQAQCFDRTTGKLLWSHDVAQGIRRDERSNFASGSPATDGRLAVFFYGNGDVVAFDLDGRRRWARNMQQDYGTFAFQWTFSSSPVLWNGKLYLQVLQRDVPVAGRGFADRENESYLLALEPETGRTLWRQVRPSPAEAESREAFSTPIPYISHQPDCCNSALISARCGSTALVAAQPPCEQAGRAQLLIAGGDVLTGHDPATGAELWRWGTWNPQRIPHWRLVVSPVAGAGVVLACAPKRDPIYALRADGSGTLDDRALAWVSREAKEVSTDVPTPAFYDGDFFVLSDVRKSLSRVEPRTGKVKWTVATPGRAKYEASPLAADGRLYLVNFDGEVAVLSADTGALLRVIPMDAPRAGEVVRASISAAHGHLFIRTTRRLYCIGPR